MTMNPLKTPPAERRHGAAVVEMAVVMPIFVMVVLGIVEFGRAMMVGQMLTNSAREATRLAIVDGSSNASVRQSIRSFLNKSIGVSENDLIVTIDIEPASGNEDPHDMIEDAHLRDLVTIVVEVPFDKVSYIPGNYLNGKHLKARSSMRKE